MEGFFNQVLLQQRKEEPIAITEGEHSKGGRGGGKFSSMQRISVPWMDAFNHRRFFCDNHWINATRRKAYASILYYHYTSLQYQRKFIMH